MTAIITHLDRDIFQYQLTAIAEEMSASLRRAAFSPIIWDMLDYSCALLSPSGEMLAQAETIPAQLGVMSYAFTGITAEIPIEQWKPGDIFICNDPYKGCTHTPDIVLLNPIFKKDRIIAIAATIAHHVDIGGKLPSTTAPDNREIFAEGLLFPPMRLVSQNIQNDTIFRFIEGNVRNPRACIGDLIAQIAGCRTGEKRVQELIDRYGPKKLDALLQATLEYGEQFVRNSLSTMPDGRNTAEIFIEDDVASNQPIRIAVTAEIKGDEIYIDFTGTDKQRQNALNCPFSSTCAMTLYAIRCLTEMDSLSNGGCNRPVHINVPKGSFLNPDRPAAVGNRHFAQQAVADVVLKALAPLRPERSAAGCHISFPTFRAGGFDTRPEIIEKYGAPKYFIVHDIIGGGMGGFNGGDGLAAVDTHGGNCGIFSAEIIETTSPIRINKTALISNSGGDGKYRGGLAVIREYELLADDLMVSVYFQQGSEVTAPWGYQGGAKGQPAASRLIRKDGSIMPLSSKEIALDTALGDIIQLESAGAGGWGCPQERALDARKNDAREGYTK